MFCKKCGAEIIEGGKFCTKCGTPVAEQPAAPQSVVQPEVQPLKANTATQPVFVQNTVLDTLFKAFASPQFLAICILLTVSFGLGLFGLSFNVIGILSVIALWLLYSAAKSYNPVGLRTPLKMLRVLNLLAYIFNCIGVGLVFLFSIILGVLGASLTTVIDRISSADIDMVISEIQDAIGSEYSVLSEYMEEFIEVMFHGGIMIFAVVMFILGIIMLLLSIFYYRSVYCCSKSFVTSYETGVNCFEKIEAVSNWVMVLGILKAISAVSSISISILALGASGTMAAALILTSIWLKKTFVK